MEAAADAIGLATLRAPARQHTIPGFIRKASRRQQRKGKDGVCAAQKLLPVVGE